MSSSNTPPRGLSIVDKRGAPPAAAPAGPAPAPPRGGYVLVAIKTFSDPASTGAPVTPRGTVFAVPGAGARAQLVPALARDATDAERAEYHGEEIEPEAGIMAERADHDKVEKPTLMKPKRRRKASRKAKE